MVTSMMRLTAMDSAPSLCPAPRRASTHPSTSMRRKRSLPLLLIGARRASPRSARHLASRQTRYALGPSRHLPLERQRKVWRPPAVPGGTHPSPSSVIRRPACSGTDDPMLACRSASTAPLPCLSIHAFTPGSLLNAMHTEHICTPPSPSLSLTMHNNIQKRFRSNTNAYYLKHA